MKRYIFPLIFACVLVYLNSFNNAFVWDDLNNIVDNEQLKGPVRLPDVFLNLSPGGQFYRPVSFLTIIFDNRLWGEEPFGYHLTNLFFHLFNVILIFYISVRLTDSPLVSFISALLFTIHPVHTEAITYISGRSDPICVFFILASFLCYIKSVNPENSRRLAYYAGSMLLFILGLLSKEIAIVFPFIILAYNGLYLNTSFKKALKKNTPFFVALALFLLFRYIGFGLINPGLRLNRALLIPKILLYYITLLIFPLNLHMQHSLKEIPFLFDMPFVLAGLLAAGVIILGLRVAKKRFMRFGIFLFLIALFPFSGIIKLNAEIAEHWLYFPSFGFFLFAGGIFSNLMAGRKRTFILAVVVLFFVILTIERNTVWRDDISIYQNTLKYRPDDSSLHYNLGNAYMRKGMFDDAVKEYMTAVDINPRDAYALNNLGIIMEKKRDIESAYRYYKKASLLEPGLDAAKENLLRLRFSSLAYAGEMGFDHSLYGDVLEEFTENGIVDYGSLRYNRAALNRYLREVAELNPENLDSMAREEKIAFYINVYNALTLKVITDYYPVKSIKDIPGVWDRIEFKVAGEDMTLNHIENEILRKGFKEPRIHFAIVCASKGCPKLAEEPFNGRELNSQLDRAAQGFINDSTRVRLDRGRHTLYLSPIFKWFKRDFGDVIGFVSNYLPEDDRRFIKRERIRIRYLNYDWSLNE